VAEPERAVLGWGGEDAGGRRGELGQGSHPLGPSAELVTPQDLLHSRWGQAHPTLGQVVDQALRADGGAGHRFGEHRLDLVAGGVAFGITGGRRPLGSSAASP
jgi:hypothetical protein